MNAAESLMQAAASLQKERDEKLSEIKSSYSEKIERLREAAQLVCEHPELRDDSYVDPHKGTLENWFVCKTCHKTFTNKQDAKR